jgi:mono/diheme cytochrome c family protein
VFGTGYKLFLGLAGGLFVIIAIAIPMVVIAASLTSGGGATASPGTTAPLLPGEEVAASAGCLACHTTDGNESVGPTWLGLAGSERELASGETVTADDAYLNESIVDPNAKIVAGFGPDLMPKTYGDSLTQDEIADIIEYINSLG